MSFCHTDKPDNKSAVTNLKKQLQEREKDIIGNPQFT